MSILLAAAGQASSCLQSLLQPTGTGASDPLGSVFSALTGTDTSQPTASSPAQATSAGTSGSPFSSEMLGALLSLQDLQTGASSDASALTGGSSTQQANVQSANTGSYNGFVGQLLTLQSYLPAQSTITAS